MTTIVNYLPNKTLHLRALVLQSIKSVGYYLAELHASYRKARDVAKTIQELNKLSNAELSDIGISRGDIYTIANKNVSDYHDKIRGRM
jgi:uncharacterized protein YjiS (DUF1127 family)